MTNKDEMLHFLERMEEEIVEVMHDKPTKAEMLSSMGVWKNYTKTVINILKQTK